MFGQIMASNLIINHNNFCNMIFFEPLLDILKFN